MMTPQEQEMWDGPLIVLAQKSGGDIRKLLYAFFSFLSRRTDFYVISGGGGGTTPPNNNNNNNNKSVGFQEGDAEKLLLASFRQFPLRRINVPRTGKGGQEKQQKQQHSSVSKSVSDDKPSSGGDKKEMKSNTKTEDTKNTNKTHHEQEQQQTSSTTTPPPTKTNDPLSDVRFTTPDKLLQIPVGNGGTTQRYKWTQTIDETTLLMAVPDGTRAKDLDVIIKPSSLNIHLKKQKKNDENQLLLQGELVERIRVDESTWTLESGVLLLTLDKIKKTWWDTVLIGDEKIDTSKVDSTRSIGSYDEVTQANIRKIIFDQNQERRGLPTSDQIVGKVPPSPPPSQLPPGVEYIDKSTFPSD